MRCNDVGVACNPPQIVFGCVPINRLGLAGWKGHKPSSMKRWILAFAVIIACGAGILAAQKML